MAITSALCTSFKDGLLKGVHDFTADTFKIALIKSGESGTYGAATTNYSELTAASDEVVGAGYTAGGETLSGVTVTTSGTVAYIDFDNPTWMAATLSVSGAIIYNTSASNAAVAVVSFGGTVTAVGGNLNLVLPVGDSSSAIIRID